MKRSLEAKEAIEKTTKGVRWEWVYPIRVTNSDTGETIKEFDVKAASFEAALKKVTELQIRQGMMPGDMDPNSPEAKRLQHKLKREPKWRP